MCQRSVSVWVYKDEWDVVLNTEEIVVWHRKPAYRLADLVQWGKCKTLLGEYYELTGGSGGGEETWKTLQGRPHLSHMWKDEQEFARWLYLQGDGGEEIHS